MAKDRFRAFKCAADKLLHKAVHGCPRHSNTALQQAADKVAQLFNKTFVGASDHERLTYLKRYIEHESRFSEFSVRLACKVAIDPLLQALEKAKGSKQQYMAFQYLLPTFVELNVLVLELSGTGRPLFKHYDSDQRVDRIHKAYRRLQPAHRRELFAWTLKLIEDKKLGDYWLLADFCGWLALGRAQVLAELVAENGYDGSGNHTSPRPFRALAFIAANY